jgi:NAD(P)-dependent dehydrogenase (short-subunit alcohol dehydrogenase family)
VIAPGDTDHGKKGASRITRTAVVTGANRGIGLEVCRQLVGGGFTTILAARDPERGLLAAKNAGGRFPTTDIDIHAHPAGRFCPGSRLELTSARR